MMRLTQLSGFEPNTGEGEKGAIFLPSPHAERGWGGGCSEADYSTLPCLCPGAVQAAVQNTL